MPCSRKKFWNKHFLKWDLKESPGIKNYPWAQWHQQIQLKSKSCIFSHVRKVVIHRTTHFISIDMKKRKIHTICENINSYNPYEKVSSKIKNCNYHMIRQSHFWEQISKQDEIIGWKNCLYSCIFTVPKSQSQDLESICICSHRYKNKVVRFV